ncbi:ArsR/SmtB family transcription factor [Leeia aquatica]|uniref:Helix-turn-helix transcriptional regulator n=1 Tax=Leeia aquatica TaxID=2725557 RepID=A0A847RUJ3_9NEIS|nr:helix-turn-helix transcriptional regulator [Leeia aquatica]NLR74880.1 helix-turn-helix transcriptional regulator [Leeia aquatica]
MNDESADARLARVAAALAEPARARMLCSLLDGRARTATELATVAEVAPSTASSHLARLQQEHWIDCLVQGRHRYYRLSAGPAAGALEALLNVAGHTAAPFQPSTPHHLLDLRTCYDHMAGRVAVALHDRLFALGWLSDPETYQLQATGQHALQALGLDWAAVNKPRRKPACACLDWSERRPHLGGVLGAALLQLARQRQWVQQDLDSRRLQLTRQGQHALQQHFGLTLH